MPQVRDAAKRAWSRGEVHHLGEARGLVGTEDQLLEHPAARLAHAARFLVGDLAERLNVLQVRHALVGLGELEVLALDRQLALVRPVAPGWMPVAKPQHEELVLGLEDDLALAAVQRDDRALRVPRAALEVDLDAAVLDLVQRRIVRAFPRPDRPAIPGLAGGVVVGVEEERARRKVARRPDPEELARLWRRALLRVPRADRPDPPRAVARADEPVDADPLAVALHPAGVAPVLRQARVVHHRARAVAADEPRLLDRERAALEGHVGLESLVRRIDDHPKTLQRLQHLDGDR